MKTQYALIDRADDRVLATDYDRAALVKLRDEFRFPERIRIWRRGVQPWMLDEDDNDDNDYRQQFEESWGWRP